MRWRRVQTGLGIAGFLVLAGVGLLTTAAFADEPLPTKVTLSASDQATTSGEPITVAADVAVDDSGDLSQPDLSQPDLSQPDLSQPDLSQPDLSQPTADPSGDVRFSFCFDAGTAPDPTTCDRTTFATVPATDAVPADGMSQATTEWLPLAPGSYHLFASYLGDDTYGPAEDDLGMIVVSARPISIAAVDRSFTYGDKAAAYEYVQTGDLNDGDSWAEGPSCGADYSAGSPAGTYEDAITCSAGAILDADGADVTSNYTVAFESGTITVAPRALVVTADGATAAYGEEPPTYGFGVGGDFFYGEDTWAIEPTCTSDYVAGSAAGEYAIACSGGDAGPNYEVTYEPGTLTVAARALLVTADDERISYGDDAPTYGFTDDGNFAGDDGWSEDPTCDSTYAPGDQASTYVDLITCSGGSIEDGEGNDVTANYDVSYEAGDLVIDPRTLTVTADDITVTDGDDAPTYTSSITAGSFFGDDAWDAEPVCSTPYGPGTPVGAYVIDCDGIGGFGRGTPGTITNGTEDVTGSYDVTYLTGTLTVEPRVPTTITYTGDTYDLGGGDTTFAASVTSDDEVCLGGATVTASATSLADESVTELGLDPTGKPGDYAATTTLEPGLYTVVVSYERERRCAPSTTGPVLLTVVGEGDTTNGGGWYLSTGDFDGTPRGNFTFNALRSTKTVGMDTVVTYRGKFNWSHDAGWRLTGEISSDGAPYAYGTYACPGSVGTAPDRACATFTGTGVLERKVGSSWIVWEDDVRFIVWVFDGGTSKDCANGKCSTVQLPDWFGVSFDPTPSAPIGEALPVMTSGGNIKAS